ncbi:MFS transporter [Clostridiaceae bacterium M8S5]|nr:MFS transporter [Clostridiaceae bacterium M8S5]
MQRWERNLYTLWISQVISLTSFGLGLPFISFYIQELGVVDQEQIKYFTGILATAPAVTMAIMAPVWGWLADRYGRKLMILRAMICSVFIIGAMGLVTNVWQLVILRGFQGLFTGTVTAATVFVAASTPKHKLSYALGIISSSTFIGYTIGPFLGGKFAEYFGYRFSFFLGSGVMLIGFLIVLFLVVEDKTDIEKQAKKQKSKNKDKNRKSIFTKLVIAMLVVLFFHRLTRTVFSPYVALYIQGILKTKVGAAEHTGTVNAIVGLTSAASGIFISRLGDKYNKLKIVTILLVFAIVTSYFLTKSDSLNMFFVLYGLLFFLIGGIEPIVTSITAENTIPERRGELFGFQGLVGSAGWIVAPMLGMKVSVDYGTKFILYLIPVFLAVNFIVLTLIRTFKKKNAYKPKSST